MHEKRFRPGALTGSRLEGGGRPIRVALLTASPVYTRTPLYSRIAADPRIDFTVIYASDGGLRPVQTGFKDPVRWDMELLAGYRSIFLRRAGINPIDGHFLTFRDRDIIPALARGTYEVLWLWGYNYLTHQLAAATQLLRRRPVIFHENQTMLDHRPVWKRVMKRTWLSALFPRGRALFVGAENYKWFRHYGVPESRMYFAPYAVDNDRFLAEAASLGPRKRELQGLLGVRPGSGPVIVTVCRLIPKKEPLLLLEAFRRVRTKLDCSIVFVGSGELEGELRRRILDEHIADARVVGFVNQSSVGTAYAAADIFVLPSSAKETWGLAINEAMNFGLPIVASNKVGSARDLVQEGKNGYIFCSGDVDQLANRLRRLVLDDRLRQGFGAASRRIVSAWNYDAAAQGVTHAIADAVAPARWESASRNIAELGD